jgi:hypothetical protein
MSGSLSGVPCSGRSNPYNSAMRLLTAHRILIGSAVVFFLFFALQRFLAYQGSGDASVLATAVVGLAAAVGLAVYYRSIGVRR